MGRSRLVLGLWLARYTIGHTIIGLHEALDKLIRQSPAARAP